jgi:peroxiredoxin
MKKRLFFCATLLFCFALLAGCSGPKPPAIALKPGTPVADFTLPGARSGTFHLKDLRGQVVLLSFINTQADAFSPTPSPSRAQIVFLKSMKQQYGPKGLTVLIVDAAQVETGKQPTTDEVINFTYNWQLDTIPVLLDEDGKVRSQFGVSIVPTTFLIGADGIIQQHWDGLAIASQLALAIEAIVGGPFYRATPAGDVTPTVASKSCAGEGMAQAKFSGLGLARSFSDEIWAVDKGEAWKVGAGYPLQWIVLDRLDKAGKDKLKLKVTGQYFDSESFVLIEQPLELVPEDEAHGFLGAGSDSLLKVFMLTTSISLQKPGCLQVQAVITDQQSGAALYNGETVVSVK